MTNDTTTLNGALQELGETMAENLTTMGVTASASDGLTTLAGKILLIETGPVTPTPSLSLTSNKDILSYYHTESATLTATLLDENDDPITGETVSFKVYKASDDSLLETLTSGTTNASGVATSSYSSKGSGDLYIKAECMNLQETYSIEDCVLANGSASVTGTATTDTVYSLGFDDLGYNLSSSDFTLEAEMICSKNGSQLNIGAKSEWSVSPIKGNYRAWIGGNSSGAGTYGTRTTSSNGSTGGSFSLNTSETVKIVKSGTSFDFYLNGTKLGTKTGATWWSNYSSFSLYIVQWNTGTTTISNIKLKLS